MVTKLFLLQFAIFRPGEENQRNDLSRNSITVKIISRQFDEAWPKNNKLQQK